MCDADCVVWFLQVLWTMSSSGRRHLQFIEDYDDDGDSNVASYLFDDDDDDDIHSGQVVGHLSHGEIVPDTSYCTLFIFMAYKYYLEFIICLI